VRVMGRGRNKYYTLDEFIVIDLVKKIDPDH
jgi:hypothetical protein